jgi:hypothetical protein
MRNFVPRVPCNGCRHGLQKQTRFQKNRYLGSITAPSAEALPQLMRDRNGNRREAEPSIVPQPERQSDVRYPTVMKSTNTSKYRNKHSTSDLQTFHFALGYLTKFIQFSIKKDQIIHRLHYRCTTTRANFQNWLKSG